MLHQTELKVGGKFYNGWKSIRINRGIEQVAGTFELQVTDRWANQNSSWVIHQGDPCQVLVDGEPVITGYVDSANPSYDKANHAITISGRDKTADLVDCAAIYQTGQWSGRRLDQIAADLCHPFGIKVLRNTDMGTAFMVYVIEPSETVFSCLERAARMKAVLLVSDGLGNLVLTRATSDAAVAILIEGENILAARAELSWLDRYSRYIVLAQGIGSDDGPPEWATEMKAESVDAAIDRYRPLIVLAEDQGIGNKLSQRAEWERSVRMGRGCRATITVAGWRNSSGRLWKPNTLVHVRSPYLGLDNDLLVVSVDYMLDENGTRTELSLARREAFELLEGVGINRLNAKASVKKVNNKERPDNSYSWL